MSDTSMANGVDAVTEIDEDLHSRQVAVWSTPLVWLPSTPDDLLLVPCWAWGTPVCPAPADRSHPSSCLLQLAVYGKESMRRMATANVLVAGVTGLGVEIGEWLGLRDEEVGCLPAGHDLSHTSFPSCRVPPTGASCLHCLCFSVSSTSCVQPRT